ncbi:23S rRNA (uracil(1939)-C(5))-methyltransferase RlmD [Legionella sp. W05-934-2]|jgi:23S rRNA (uracil1939-C5)-methyltransferase|uniref:23S rRNA (uracil(1939)-C(5))-methyltransferase RlmD n=1 Tax=Legionella sp. W05-934-2 TaxID=1198649 RepID=UPI003461E160
MNEKKSKKAIYETTIDSFSHEGRGVARVEGKTTFIQGALEGEKVLYELTFRKKDFDQANVVDILEPAGNRVAPKCEHYQYCGGCSLQHLSHDGQIAFKQWMFSDTLARFGHVTPEAWVEPIVGPAWSYRHKARLSVRHVHKKGGVLVGFREKRQPKYITDIEQCRILAPSVGDNIVKFKQLLDQFDNLDTIAQIEVAVGDDETALILRNLAPLTDNEQRLLMSFANENHYRIFLQPGNYETVSLFYPKDDKDYLQYHLSRYNITFDFHPTDFTQINPVINEQMIDQAIEWLALNDHDVVLDLFCGLGNFSLPLALKAKQVIGIEGSESMVERANHNRLRNHIENAQFFAADLSKENALVELIKLPIDKALIDPPRTGALEIVKQLSKLNINRIVYVSCNPATLARDADYLVNQAGYRLVKAGIMDMFPQTSHVESMAVFER